MLAILLGDRDPALGILEREMETRVFKYNVGSSISVLIEINLP